MAHAVLEALALTEEDVFEEETASEADREGVSNREEQTGAAKSVHTPHSGEMDEEGEEEEVLQVPEGQWGGGESRAELRGLSSTRCVCVCACVLCVRCVCVCVCFACHGRQYVVCICVCICIDEGMNV